MSERRREPRMESFFPVRIDSQQKHDRIGVTRNASGSGLLIGTPSRFAVGEEVELTFARALGEPAHKCKARVVRVGYDADADLFCRLVAVALDSRRAA